LDYDWKTLLNTNNKYINIDGFINETKDSIILHFANPTNDTILIDFNAISFTNNDSIFTGTVVNEYVLNANSWQSNNTACYELNSNTLDKSYIINNQSLSQESTYTIPNFSIGKITLALNKSIPSKITTNKKSLKLKLYPNLSKNNITVQLENQSATKHKFQIVDINGKVIHQFYNNQSNFTIDIHDYKQGTYFLKAEDSQQNYVIEKFIIQH
ncbi:MAG: T9SS type A sorting domain-containing protein, partial [Romboutsia sp.]|nr:T9SS type A sorting domain-containing protein [Romboutsia sp.]